MGAKKRGLRAAGDAKGKKAQTPRRRPRPKSNAKVPEDATEKAELDDDYVHYESSSDDNAKSKPKRPRIGPTMTTDAQENGEADNASNDSDSSVDDDEIGAEIGLRDNIGEESDVDATFDFFDPRPDDVPSVSAFLTPWVKRCSISKKLSMSPLLPSDVAETVCAQTRVGTTIRVDEQDAPIGFITCLNVRRHAELLQPLRAMLKGRCKDGMQKLVENCFEGKGRFEREKMGLVVCERVVNLPPMVVPKLLEAVFSEIGWAVEDEPTTELREDYRFGWYLYISEVFVAEKGDEDGAEEEIGFVKVEDEAWAAHATHEVRWSIGGGGEEDGSGEMKGMKRKGMALVIAANKVDKVRKRVTEMVGAVESLTGEEPEQEGEQEAEQESGQED